MILALSITPAVLAVLALGILVYFKFFALVYDKDGMVYKAQGGPHLCNPPHSEDDDPIDGGATDNSDTNAPKSIESTQIISFDCRFSTMDVAETSVSFAFSCSSLIESAPQLHIVDFTFVRERFTLS